MPDRVKLKTSGIEIWDPDTGFSASDCRAYLLFRTRDNSPVVEPVEFGEVATVAVSAHRDKFPVARLGEVNPIGFTAGHRTIAGSLVTLFTSTNTLRQAVKALFQKFVFPSFWKGPIRPRPDEIPPFDLILTFFTEQTTWAIIVLKGVTLLDEGFQINVEQPSPFISMSFLAADYEVRYPGDEQWVDVDIPIPVFMPGRRLPNLRPGPSGPPSSPDLPALPLDFQRVRNFFSWFIRGRRIPQLEVRPLSKPTLPETPMPTEPLVPGQPAPQVQPLRPNLGATQPLWPRKSPRDVLEESLPKPDLGLEEILPSRLKAGGQTRGSLPVDPWYQMSVVKQLAVAPDVSVDSGVDDVERAFRDHAISLVSRASSATQENRYFARVVELPADWSDVSDNFRPSVHEVAYRFRMDQTLPLWNAVRGIDGSVRPVDRSWLIDNTQSVASIDGVSFYPLEI